MPHVVTEPCVFCKSKKCVAVCPVDCFYEGQNMLYIHPDECIDCLACAPVCPQKAIYPQDDVPEKWREFIELNTEMAGQAPRAEK